jgi:hypothetical protein
LKIENGKWAMENGEVKLKMENGRWAMGDLKFKI